MKIKVGYLKSKNDIVEVVGQIPAQKGDLLLAASVSINDKDEPVNICEVLVISHYLFVKFPNHDISRLVAVYIGDYGCVEYAPAEPGDEEIIPGFSLVIANYENYKYTASLVGDVVLNYTQWIQNIQLNKELPIMLTEF